MYCSFHHICCNHLDEISSESSEQSLVICELFDYLFYDLQVTSNTIYIINFFISPPPSGSAARTFHLSLSLSSFGGTFEVSITIRYLGIIKYGWRQYRKKKYYPLFSFIVNPWPWLALHLETQYTSERKFTSDMDSYFVLLHCNVYYSLYSMDSQHICHVVFHEYILIAWKSCELCGNGWLLCRFYFVGFCLLTFRSHHIQFSLFANPLAILQYFTQPWYIVELRNVMKDS